MIWFLRSFPTDVETSLVELQELIVFFLDGFSDFAVNNILIAFPQIDKKVYVAPDIMLHLLVVLKTNSLRLKFMPWPVANSTVLSAATFSFFVPGYFIENGSYNKDSGKASNSEKDRDGSRQHS